MKIRHGLVQILVLMVAAAAPPALAQLQERITLNYFDPLAPTMSVEDILEYRARAGAAAEARRNASLQASRSCMAQAGAATPKPAAPAAASAPALTAVREDLKHKSLMELALLYRQKPDPEVAAAIQWKSSQDGAAARPPAPAVAAAGARPSLDQRLLQLMDRQAKASQPTAQECLEAAEKKGEKWDGQVPANELSYPGSAVAMAAIQDGSAISVVVDMFSPTFPMPEKDGKPVNFKMKPTGRLARYNVVARSGPHGQAAIPVEQAYAASYKPDREHWPDPPVQEPTPAVRAEPSKPKPSVLQKLRDLAGAVKP